MTNQHDDPAQTGETASFPRLQARSLRFTLGIPRNVSVSPDGGRVLFVRTRDGSSRTGLLWSYDVESGEETCLVDPTELLGGDEELSAQERARRERSRESGAGIVGYDTDDAWRYAVFTLSGRLWCCDLETGTSTELAHEGAAIDPRIDPTGRNVAYATEGGLRAVGVNGALDQMLVRSDDPDIVWGQAEFVAAEEMDRYRGFWWAPDGASLLVERYDNRPVATWYVADPANPGSEPVPHRYPAAGTADADVTLWHLTLDGGRTEVQWDRTTRPYLTRVSWSAHGDPVVQVMSRDQRDADVLAVDVETGATRTVRSQHDDTWVDLVVGAPAYGPGGLLVTAEDHEDTKKVFVDGEPVSPAGLQVRAILSVDEDGVLVSGAQEPTEVHVHRIGFDGTVDSWTDGPAVHSGTAGGGTTIIGRSGLDSVTPRFSVRRAGREVGTLGTDQLDPGFAPAVRLLHAGERAIRTAVLLPRDHVPGSARLPVLLDPYGGPHAQRVVASARGLLESQWLADQGFCVVVADGRGTPGRGPAWDRTVRDDFAGVTLQDQVDALQAVARELPDDVDTGRVAMTGWSYGGYLAALAVLARPDVFHAAVAGAPPADWRLYDTFYTERYLGHPDEQPDVYDRNSLMSAIDADRDLPPLMIIHGMVDDNVVVGHTLRLSSALLEAGKPHTVLPLTGVTHMASQESVAENLKVLQVDFLKRALAGPTRA